MQLETNPRRIEKSFIFMQSRDGILDMFFGLMLVIPGINSIFSWYGWDVPWYLRYGIIILLIPFILGKILVTSPRTGYVRMKPVAGGRKQILTIFLAISMTMTLLLLAAKIFKVPGFNGETVSFNPVIEFGFLVILFSFIAWLIGVYSLFFFGICTAVGWPVAEMTGLVTIAGLPAEVFTFCFPGLIITIFGIVRLIRFLKNHPKENLKSDYEPEKQ
ncbi:MAG: hypothetical protein V2A67_06680 [Bacteroidota bacterium]